MKARISRKLLPICAALLAVLGLLACSSPESEPAEPAKLRAPITLPSGFVEEDVSGTWGGAVGLTFSEDGRMFVWEKAGKVWEVLADGTRRNQPLIDISQE